MQNGRCRRLGTLMLAGVMTFGLILGGCGKEKSLFNPSNPVSLTIWHYYNGPQMAAFDALVEEFNNTVGKEKGIYVTSYSKSSVTDLETAINDALDEKVGAEAMPDMFSSYAGWRKAARWRICPTTLRMKS